MVGALLAGGCGSSSPEQRIEKARQDYQKHDYHAAEVQLKTVLQKQPDNGQAWALLGRTSLAERQFDDAIHQFRKAISAGQSQASVAVPFGRALVASGQFQQALDTLEVDSQTSDHARALAISLKGDALAGLQKTNQAAKAYAQALSIEPDLSDALRGKARLAVQRGDMQSARQVLSQAVTANGNDAGALELLGQVEYRTQHCEPAIQHLGQALKVGKGVLSNSQVQTSRVLMADCQLRTGQVEAAKGNIQTVLSANQSNPFGNYLQSLLYIRQGEYQQAANHVQSILNVEPRNLRAMTLMAWLRIAQGRPQDAQPFLTRVLQQSPDNVAALRLQAGLWMAQNRDDQARDLVEKAYQQQADTPGLRGALKQVMAELEQQQNSSDASERGLDDVTLQLGLARSLAQMGSESAAQTILEKIQPKTAAQRRKVETARVQIALANNAASDAIQRAKTLVKQNPDDLGAKRLLADSYIAAGEYDTADDILAEAQQSHPDSESLVQARTQLATQRGNYAQALELLEPLHDQKPDNVDITLALADLYGRAGNDDDRIALLKQAVQSKPQAPRLSKALARAYLGNGQHDQALALVEKQLKQHSQDPDWFQLKGVTLLTSGQVDAGIKALSQAAQKAPDRPGLSLDVAKAQLSQGRTDQAIQSLKELREQSPDFWPAAAFLALAQASAGQTAAALDQVKALRSAGHAHEADILDGDVLRQAKRYAQANRAYSKAFEAKPNARLAQTLFDVRRAGNIEDPAAPLREWLEQSPNDAATALRLASWYQAQDETDKAAAMYRKVLASHGDAVVALNNLAVIETDSNPQQALSYAQKAHANAPGSPAITDTLGWVLVNNDQLNRGIELLEQAESKVGADRPEIRFHLGAALSKRAQADDTVRAKKLLNQALSGGLPEAQAERARELISRLSQGTVKASNNS
ncbi:XrtA/PEP-CTERM system TPR-repeat protein PrsT [Salinisphaera sp. SPP-AMP-43]|uniref:XrtA/PEP-CTERM system TPR-repeat protein PrsT n=1 Tax=Salinisphaera sp. SPP-AMP-43 TaxID=3121288 RepID=UPI003C6E5FC8